MLDLLAVVVTVVVTVSAVAIVPTSQVFYYKKILEMATTVTLSTLATVSATLSTVLLRCINYFSRFA